MHLFTDGRDSRPNSALELLAKLPKEDFIRLSSLSGRFYAMDREKHWDRTQKTYQVLVGEGPITENIETHIKKTYGQKLNDEFIEPARIGADGGIQNNDSLIFFNFREDRMKQIASAFIDKNFQNFPVKNFNNLYIAAMVQYDDDFNVPIAFPPKKLKLVWEKFWPNAKKINSESPKPKNTRTSLISSTE